MQGLVSEILWGWVVGGLILLGVCARRSPLAARRAMWFLVIFGWAILPTADFSGMGTPHSGAVNGAGSIPDWFMPTALAAGIFWTKATAIGLTVLAGLLVFDRSRLRGWQWGWYDGFMVLWCLAPLGAACLGRVELPVAGRNVAYLVLAWGGPYVVGRLYAGDRAGLREVAAGLILGGLLYLPICILEGVIGPWVYAACYGYQPLQHVGAVRYLGFRPVGFMEDGNQLGMWLAGAALLAYWLWRSGVVMPWSQRWMTWIVLILLGQTLAAQSAGAIILLSLGILILELGALVHKQAQIILMLCVVVVIVGVGGRLAMQGSVRHWAKESPVGRFLTHQLKALDRGSLGWRINLEEQNLKRAWEYPLVGWGRWDWWHEGDKMSTPANAEPEAGKVQGKQRPWGLWMLVLGQVGLVGLLGAYGVWGMAVWQGLIKSLPMGWRHSEVGIQSGSAVLLLVMIGDSLLNGAILLPDLLVVGGLVSCVKSWK